MRGSGVRLPRRPPTRLFVRVFTNIRFSRFSMPRDAVNFYSMQRRLLDLLWRLGLAFGAVAAATVLTLVVWRFSVGVAPRVAPFFFLGAVLACAWSGGYTAGIASVLFTTIVGNLVTKRTLDIAQ